MTFHMLWVIALGLSMDAFAVSISKGLAMRAFGGNKHWPLHAVSDYSKVLCPQLAMLLAFNLVRLSKIGTIGLPLLYLRLSA